MQFKKGEGFVVEDTMVQTGFGGVVFEYLILKSVPFRLTASAFELVKKSELEHHPLTSIFK
jgi:hypothetical protein